MSSSQAKSDPTAEDEKHDYMQQLRQELKDFEHAYAKENGGKKPSKDAVKKDVAIAEKYKEYNRLRAGGSSKSSSAAPSKSSKSSSSSSKPTSSSTSKPTCVAPSPRKPSSTAPDISATPTKNTANSPWAGEIYESPLSVRRQRLFGRRDQVGPTPQKTGRVLGIFDSFIDVESTPPRSIHATPTKKKFEGLDRVSASPASIAKSHKDDSPFLTPRKRKLEDLKNDDPFATPTALRSWAPPAVADGEIESPKVRRPPSMPKRGLSSLLKELKEMEEHLHDDDEEALREMEAEAEGGPPPEKKKEKKGVFDEPELPPLPPGAFVEETLVDEDEGKEGEPQRVWKKKGLKRQHRRVIMRPVPAPKTKNPEAEGEEPEGPEEEEEEEQQPPSDVEYGEDPHAPPEEFSESGSDFEDVDSEGDGESKAKKAKKTPKAADKKKAPAAKGVVAEKATTAKGPARKINPNATSHMNFQKLNIKNKNSKGKGRGGGRFGRRR
ncbi:DNA replication/checkpoint protein [Pyronema domesticum]|nr:DNA replication/checkpoint protein [Pyronema domesticum]